MVRSRIYNYSSREGIESSSYAGSPICEHFSMAMRAAYIPCQAPYLSEAAAAAARRLAFRTERSQDDRAS